MWRNHEGLTVCHALIIRTPLVRLYQPAASLEEDFPQVTEYLNSVTAMPLADSHDGEPENRVSNQLLSQRSQEATSEHLTSSLMSQLSDISQNETIGNESHRDEEVRQAVSRAVLESLVTGYTMTTGDPPTHTHSDKTDG